ncbi:EscU/YscU/HrcU family type III secretion system export apparatus switch protein [Bacillus sporothermodurans]|uniref:EscU/YscU/HrcU family type III secretion system export apparatus switch protein n=1 Tax=Heyndrickxia sporothermodurans TaxID=46224 RepID=UPI00192A702F|nr:EscU/YscU/HrcU family type III secretion system export apparatus switch protein [Heyndrickxia sporothermodurans]MBL5808022.1 EscU/YscU/HrcU family type III secretion system export apparatus switch protein [Heyndrickxia sporothermodurans]MBL5857911.1 EscU/YscU/HrcU family type III secretion system export apparatus switch protein [Heyndrickxia sporothermodurans]MBL5870813.1 EscU/YscU/HrcU family type III secretion system export apparatus switch protein [Heyndrickxia sporothermodurans]
MSETNKRQQAIALKYQSEIQDAPKVIAKGKGLTAENIIEVAKEKNITIQEDHNLVELLSQLEINETIPEELYEAVAEVFAFIYRLDRNIAN